MQREVIIPEVLVLASRFDHSCDHVTTGLKRRGLPYFRLNTEDIDLFAIEAKPREASVIICTGDVDVNLMQSSLRSVYFRRGVYPRQAHASRHSADDQLSSAHKSVFMRSFMMFDSCLWVNHPVATYAAEHKMLQLAVAKTVGFEIPRTVITNHSSGIRSVAAGDAVVAVKGLDTVFVNCNDVETFGYTTILDTESAAQAYMASAPLIAQQAITNKIDLRVTVVGDKVFCNSVQYGDEPIEGDWRPVRDTKFPVFDLPQDIAKRCAAYVDHFNLSFGAIDLLLQNGTYFFLELNPTGEWEWLVDRSGLPIDDAIVEKLAEGA